MRARNNYSVMIKVGQKLQEERLKKELTIEQVSEATKIRTEFLEAIEESQYERLPSPAYAHGFVRNYAKFLNLPEEEMLAIFRREFDVNKAFDVLPKGLSQSREFSIKRLRPNRSFIFAGIAIIILLVFIIYQYRFAFINPPLEVFTPKEGAVINSLSVKVSGMTNPDATVFIGNEPVSLENDGSFEKNLTFFPGKTTVNIRVVNRFGKETMRTIPIEVKPGS